MTINISYKWILDCLNSSLKSSLTYFPIKFINVIKCKCGILVVVNESNGRSKGYGFVRFSEETDQQKALIEMQHMTGVGRKPIRVSLATPKR